MLEICWGQNEEIGSVLFVLIFGMITPNLWGLHSFKLGTWSYNQDFKTTIFGVFWDLLPIRNLPKLPELHFCVLWVKKCRSLPVLSSAGQRPVCTSVITPHVTQISRGAKALFPSSLQKCSCLWTLYWLCALWWGGLASQVLQVKLVMTQRCEWARGLGCGCCSCLHLMPCVVVVAAECRHQRGELTL